MVDDELKRIAGMAFERISAAPERALTDKASGHTHRLEFNLEPPGKAGSVISAVYKTPTNVELNFSIRRTALLSRVTKSRTLRSSRGRNGTTSA